MSTTSGSFTPPAAPPCPYTPRMTRADALALRAAGGLRENCVVVITDGPTIGTAGKTSVTEIELNPVSPTELGTTARVHTTFAASAWPGVYDIDLGAAGTITELRDGWGNTAKDIDADAATVHTQFPWHLGSATMRDNYVEDSALPGWDTQLGVISNNRIINSTVNLTGKVAGALVDNVFQSAGLVLGAGGGTANLTRSQVIGASPGTVLVNHTGTGTLSFTDVVQRDGFVVAHSATAALTVANSTLHNHGAAAIDLNHAGGVGTSILDSTVIAAGAGAAPTIEALASAGAISVGRSTLNGTRLSKAAGSTGSLSVSACDMTDCTLTVGPSNGASTNTWVDVQASQSTFTLNGPVAAPARNDFTTGARIAGTTFTVAATATAGLNVQGGDYNNVTGGVTQNRTAGTGSTGLYGCVMRGFSTFTDNGTTDPGVGTSFNRLSLTDSVITVGNVSGKTLTGTVLQQAELTGSTLNLTGPSGSAFINRLRMRGATLTNAGFDGSDLIIDGAFTKTMTASQANRLCNKAFDDWL
ncbi:hypothetical protein GTY54_43045 [Streptomyces sp. SID625]|nr:hypothetical protein [Streptomyces sp. SID625]